MLAVDAFLMGCTDKRSARSALDRDPKTVDEAVLLMRRYHGHAKALSVERRVRTLVLEEVDHGAPQVNRVLEERPSSLDVGELNENIEKLTKLFRWKGASASGVMVGCRVDGVDVDLGDGHGNYSMTMYVADITDNCILGLDYLKARQAVIDLSQGVLVVNDTIVKGKYKYAEGTPVMTYKVRLVKDSHFFPNSISRATVRIKTDDIHPVVVQARKNGPYLVPNTLLMPADVR